MAINLASNTSSAVLALANLLYACCDNPEEQSGRPWPLGGLDFSGEGDVTISIDGVSGKVTYRFARAGSPVLSGTLDLTILEAHLVTAPNYLNAISQNAAGPSPSIVYATPQGLTRQRSGIVYVDGEMLVTQSAQEIVTFALYRDYGLSGQVQLDSEAIAPGGLGAFPAKSHMTAIDTLPNDGQPHAYTVVATGSAGSQLTLGVGAANVQAFELGGPG